MPVDNEEASYEEQRRQEAEWAVGAQEIGRDISHHAPGIVPKAARVEVWSRLYDKGPLAEVWWECGNCLQKLGNNAPASKFKFCPWCGIVLEGNTKKEL